MGKQAVSAAGKALDLVEAVMRADIPPRLTDLAESLELHRGTASRILADLVQRGWLTRFEGRYHLGAVTLQATQSAKAHSITALCRPTLERLAATTGMMTNVQVLEPDGARLIDAVRPQRYSMITRLLGALLPAHTSAGALALLSALPESKHQHYLDLATKAGYPLTGPTGLHNKILETQTSGFALVRHRSRDIVSSMGRAVNSAAGHPTCAITIVGLDTEFDEDTVASLKEHLRASVQELEELFNERNQ